MLAPLDSTDVPWVAQGDRFLTGNPPFFRRAWRRRPPRRYGRGPLEVIVVLGIVAFALMIILVAMPKGRESARMAGCQKNLMQIGVGLQMYCTAQGHFPTFPVLDGTRGDSPIQAMLDAFVIPDLLEMKDPTKPPRPSRVPPRGTRIPGLACPSDSNAFGGVTSPLISYRANSGDTPGGLGGPFQPGRTSTIEGIEAADGLSFTAAYAERLVGTGTDRMPGPPNYASITGPIVDLKVPPMPDELWRGDAGSRWDEASWRSTLYTHALEPNAPRSCIAADGRTALIGVSSFHVNRINVLMMDGSLKGVTPSIEPKVWQGLGTVGVPDAIERTAK